MTKLIKYGELILPGISSLAEGVNIFSFCFVGSYCACVCMSGLICFLYRNLAAVFPFFISPSSELDCDIFQHSYDF